MMRRALRLAAGAAIKGEVPIAAVVWRERDGAIEIVAEAANDREASGDPTGTPRSSRSAAPANGSDRGG